MTCDIKGCKNAAGLVFNKMPLCDRHVQQVKTYRTANRATRQEAAPVKASPAPKKGR